MNDEPKYRIGCPIWSCPKWRGSVYKAKSPKANWLGEYSEKFTTVEGNTTFYGIPKLDTFKRWADETHDNFRFALKFPRKISHELQLVGAESETGAFLEGLEVLHEANRLGPSFIQLGPNFGPARFEDLKRYLLNLPQQFPYAVEVRHPEYFEPIAEQELNSLLAELSIDRVIFDSRPLFSAPPEDEVEEAAQKRKPQVPIRTKVTGSSPILRLIGRNDVETAKPWIKEWSSLIEHWISKDLTPYLFAHTPDDRHAPDLASQIIEGLPDKRKIRLRPHSSFRQNQKMLF